MVSIAVKSKKVVGSDLLVGWVSAVCLQELSVPLSFFSGCSDFHLQFKDKFVHLTGDSELTFTFMNELQPFVTFMVSVIITMTFNII